ncbi:hypothetical protein LEP1GSC115_4837 [Leptospira interrogans serovar Australis str. 200703203]|uniref:Uncharacterized protein n=1 Tax=Leptospira interrogans serovar Australis str. 200703203 TaxID=1085541 RepID=N1UFZ6_LEPIR|nr:hypothetical protein LEP1GSC115_4837 [Leptospira interrogans serovar Australis str. 200703203]
MEGIRALHFRSYSERDQKFFNDRKRRLHARTLRILANIGSADIRVMRAGMPERFQEGGLVRVLFCSGFFPGISYSNEEWKIWGFSGFFTMEKVRYRRV